MCREKVYLLIFFRSYSARPGVQIDNALSSFQQVFNFDPYPW